MEPEGSFLHDQHQNSSSSEQEENRQPCLALSNVDKIMRKVVPTTTMISDQAKEAVAACANEFIGFITMEANELCLKEHRSTVTAEDLLLAMARLGFHNYVNTLTIYLHRYRSKTNMPPPRLPVPALPVQPMPQMGQSSSSSGKVMAQFEPFTYLNRDRFLDG